MSSRGASRRARRLLHLAMLAVTAAPGIALAAEPSGEGMPQLRFGDDLLIAQVVWLLIIFGWLYFIMANFALPRVASVLEERRRRIEGDLEAARQAKAEADAALAAHRQATQKARAEAQAAIAAAMQSAQAEATARNEALAARLAETIKEAEGSIAVARDRAMGALREVSIDTTQALVARLAGQAQAAAVGAAVDRALIARGLPGAQQPAEAEGEGDGSQAATPAKGSRSRKKPTPAPKG